MIYSKRRKKDIELFGELVLNMTTLEYIYLSNYIDARRGKSTSLRKGTIGHKRNAREKLPDLVKYS